MRSHLQQGLEKGEMEMFPAIRKHTVKKSSVKMTLRGTIFPYKQYNLTHFRPMFATLFETVRTYSVKMQLKLRTFYTNGMESLI